MFVKNQSCGEVIETFTLIFVKELIEDETFVNRVIRRLVRLPNADIHILLQNYDLFKTYVLETYQELAQNDDN